LLNRREQETILSLGRLLRLRLMLLLGLAAEHDSSARRKWFCKL
jgi:hypothetical protein